MLFILVLVIIFLYAIIPLPGFDKYKLFELILVFLW